MISDFKKISSEYLKKNNADSIAVGIIDFSECTYQSFELQIKQEIISENIIPEIYFDLASVTKPLTNSLGYFANTEVIDQEMLLLLNHRGGLPAWGLLPQKNWRDQIFNYPIIESETLYSDFSANRFMLEFNRRSKRDLKSVCQEFWDSEVLHWLDLPKNLHYPQCGFVNGCPNFGEVHDPNAWNVKEFMSHAGLFATVNGVCRTLLNFEKNLNLLVTMENLLQQKKHRFVLGWDTAQGEATLAGNNCSSSTFGHLGFTGTSIWIDCKRKMGQVILTNATKEFWYDKKELNHFRRLIGNTIWESGSYLE